MKSSQFLLVQCLVAAVWSTADPIWKLQWANNADSMDKGLSYEADTASGSETTIAMVTYWNKAKLKFNFTLILTLSSPNPSVLPLVQFSIDDDLVTKLNSTEWSVMVLQHNQQWSWNLRVESFTEPVIRNYTVQLTPDLVDVEDSLAKHFRMGSLHVLITDSRRKC